MKRIQLILRDVGIVREDKKPLEVLHKSVQEDLQPFQRLMDAKKAALKRNLWRTRRAATNFLL